MQTQIASFTQGDRPRVGVHQLVWVRDTMLTDATAAIDTPDSNVVYTPTEALKPASFAAVARGRATVELAPDDWQSVSASAEQLAEVVRARRLVYGITTGFGPLAQHLVGADEIATLQRNLIYHLATGVGQPLAWDEARAVVLARLLVILRGHSGADPALVRALLHVLAAGLAPCIPEQGTVGASGDLTPLSHVALALMGEGEFLMPSGQRLAAHLVLAQHGVAPYRFGRRDALALVNGTSCMTGLAGLNAADAERALAWSVSLSSAHGELLHGRLEAWDTRLAALRGHPGQIRVTRWLEMLSDADGAFTRGHTAETLLAADTGGASLPASPQDPYTIRCVPQLLGAVADVLAEHRRVVEIELHAVTDNPVLVDEPPHALHGGNFFGQHVGFASDSLTMALVQQAVLAERQIARLVDIRQNDGLFPAFLQPDRIGLQSGFMGAQVTASALVAELRTRAIPASIQSIPTNANNQDVVSMGTIAARKTRDALRDLYRVLAIQALAVAQAADLAERKGCRLTANTRALRSFARRTSPFLSTDRPLSRDIEKVASEMRVGIELPRIMTNVSFGFGFGSHL